jgi:hypothetical protein
MKAEGIHKRVKSVKARKARRNVEEVETRKAHRNVETVKAKKLHRNMKKEKVRKSEDTMQKKKKVLLYFLLIMIACTILGRMANGASMPRVSVEKPKSDYVTHTVRSVGMVEKNAEEGIYTLPGMIIKKMHVNTGDTVKKEDNLFEIDLEVLEEQLIAKQNELKKLELQKTDEESQNQVNAENRNRGIRQAQESYNQTVTVADEKVNKAKQELEAANKLLENAVEITAEEREALEIDIATKKDALKEVENMRNSEVLSATQNVEGAKAREATRSTVEGLRIDEEQLRKDIEKLTTLKEQQGMVRASVDGVVTSVSVRTGEQTGNTATMLLADNSKGYRFVAEVTKDDNKHLSIGQEVSLSSTSGKESVEKLKIESILASEEDAETMRVTVNVTASQFYIGESVEMLAKQGVKQYPICLPLSAICEENNENFVYILENEKTILGEVTVVKKQKVIVVDKNETTAAISPEGLTERQNVVVGANKELKDGIRVRMEES